jgi:heme oxygenase
MMDSPTLKSLTWDLHKQAEQTALMTHLLDNTISDHVYAHLVYTKYQIYHTIEQRIKFKCADLYRAQKAWADWTQMGHVEPPMLSSLVLMLDHLNTITDYSVWAHVYVHYLAPLYGGQLIRRTIQNRFPTTMYEFDNPDMCKQEIRQMLTVDMATEANKSFAYTIQYYNQLWDHHATLD